MALEIHHREREGIEILDLKGRITIGEEDLLLRDELQRLIKSGKRKVILNLQEISLIDSVGVGTLIYARTTLGNLGGGLALVNLKLSHLELFLLLKLEVVFDIYHEELDAVNSFFPERVVNRVDVLSLVQYLREKSVPAEKG